MILATHALASWLKSQGLDPSEITVVLRAKTLQTEMLLKSAIIREIVGHLLPSTGTARTLSIPPLDVLPTSFKITRSTVSTCS